MTATATPIIIIRCPVCGSEGAMIRHDIRASLLYACMQCSHEWQIDPANEPSQTDAGLAKRRGAAAAPGRSPLT